MPENLKACIVVVAIFLAAGGLFCRLFPHPTFRRWTWVTMVVTVVGFLTNVWGVVVSIAYVAVAAPRDSRVAWYLLLLPALPAVLEYDVRVSSASLIVLTYPRILLLAIMLPVVVSQFLGWIMGARPFRDVSFSSTDIFVVSYGVLVAVLSFRDTSTTVGARLAMGIGLDILLPYFVISRSVRSVGSFRQIAWALLLASVLQSSVGLFEEARQWLLYASMSSVWGNPWRIEYVSRVFLRVTAAGAQPLALGYFLVIGLAALVLVWDQASKRRGAAVALGALLVVCLLLTGSRGPYLEALLFLGLWVWFRASLVSKLAVGCIVLIALMASLNTNLKSSTDDSLDYRARLAAAATEVIGENPVWGTPDFLSKRAFTDLIQGQGIIDVTNVYLQQALAYGLVGVGLFVASFVSLLVRTVRYFRSLYLTRRDALLRIGTVLVCLSLANLFILSDVSSYGYIPSFYWALLGLGAAWVTLAEKELTKGLAA